MPLRRECPASNSLDTSQRSAATVGARGVPPPRFPRPAVRGRDRGLSLGRTGCRCEPRHCARRLRARRGDAIGRSRHRSASAPQAARQRDRAYVSTDFQGRDGSRWRSVTAPARTLRDCATDHPPEVVEKFLAKAETRGLVSRRVAEWIRSDGIGHRVDIGRHPPSRRAWNM